MKIRYLLSSALVFAATLSAQAQTIVGAWSFGDTTTTDSGVLVFFNNGVYFHIENTVDMNGSHGFERGTYNWSGVNGTAFTVTPDNDTNGGIGLSTLNVSTTTLTIIGDTFQFDEPDGIGTTGDILTRVTGADALVGAWYVGNPSLLGSTNDSGVAVFMSNGTFFLARDLAAGDPDGADEMEHGFYTWDSVTGAFAITSTLIDQNANVGLNSGPPITSFTISGNILTGIDAIGPFTLTSVTIIPEPSTYALMLSGSGLLALAAYRRRKTRDPA